MPSPGQQDTREEVVSIWVQLLRDRQIDSKIFARGSWVEVGRQAALRWIAEGAAIAVTRTPFSLEVGPECGIVVRGDERTVKTRLMTYGLDCKLASVGPTTIPDLTHQKQLIWHSDARLRIENLPAGFGFLDRWDVAIPLWDHQTLASEVGTVEDRARTEAIIRDLRVPLYQPGVIFARDSEASRVLLGAWQLERAGRTDERLALLRALYRVKPLILALPRTWVE